ncbi:hypothetical protein B0F90DRAFT_1820697 [Multifurca ochricompacta]|uniref:YMC020W-like alpha/beta hydrolase domain-containing protein n=1 Tax=Multifurca ochricompacta TaxID=376703 RepID=A0AAD4LZ35_9AGAM|nr:hypothetical protein B0F90DRAFT_1820697 [Multifurca ochricompacta]
MTSTPRSTKSFRSTLPWRTSPKNRAPTSLSLIIATPEVSSPLTSAATHLPPIKMASDADVKARSNTTEDEPQHHRAHPVLSPSPTEEIGAPSTSDQNAARSSPGETGTTPSPTPAPQSRSWLASLSRRSSSSVPLNELVEQSPRLSPGERSKVSEPSTSMIVASPPNDQPEIIPSSLPDSDLQKNNVAQSETVSKTIPSKRAWFTSSKQPSKLRLEDEPSSTRRPAQMDSPSPETSQPPVTNVIPPTPPRSEPTQVEGKPPSPEAEVRAASPLAAPQAGVDSPQTPSSIDDQVPKLPSPGPPSESVASPPLFAGYSLPWASKVPLDRAIASAKATDILTEREADSPSAVSKDSNTEGKEQPAAETTGLPQAQAIDDGTLPGPTSANQLVGLRHKPEAAATDTASRTTDVPNTPAPAEETHPESTFEITKITARAQGSTDQVEVQAPSKAEAEAVKEAPAIQEPAPPAHLELTNPIESSITANTSGWASFFSSKSLLVKRIAATEHPEENTMEVMDIDDGVEESSGAATIVATSEVRTAKDVVSRDTQVTKTAPAPPPSPSPSLKPKTKPDKRPDDLKGTKRMSVSPTPSKGSGRASPRVPPPPNLVLPTWEDTFHAPPRSTMLHAQTDSAFTKTVRFVSGMLFAKDGGASTGKGKAPTNDDRSFADFGRELPRTWDVIGEKLDGDVLRGCKRVVVIGIHGWFPGAVMRTVLGEPTGTSGKFVTMMCQALEVFQEQNRVQFEKVTQIPLEGEGTISKRVEKLYNNLTANSEWMNDLHVADAVLVATHSQGSIVSTHLLDRLIHDKHIRASRTSDLLASAAAVLAPGAAGLAEPPAQRVCCLALCGIHLGPLRYLSSSSLVQPYIQYFESAAAKELFQFQSTNSEVSKDYVKALRNVVDRGVKMVFIASLNDQVVPLYSGLFTAASHPLILRALYIDGDAYHSSDFLSNLLVLLLRVMNVGLSDSGLVTHLSEATAGSLNGIGHSSVYEELATYSLAVNYLFMTNHGSNEHPELVVQPFDANTELNDYEIPWALRDLIANERVEHFFAKDFAKLRNAFPDWHPKTAILRDIKRKLQPIQRLNANLSTGSSPPKL